MALAKKAKAVVEQVIEKAAKKSAPTKTGAKKAIKKAIKKSAKKAAKKLAGPGKTITIKKKAAKSPSGGSGYTGPSKPE